MVPHLKCLPGHDEVPRFALLADAERVSRQCPLNLDTLVALRGRSLHAARARGAVRAHILYVDRRSDDLNVLERELRALCDDVPICRDQRAAVVVKPVAVAALLVRVKVDAADLREGLAL